MINALDANSPVTSSSQLKLSQAELEYLDSFLSRNDRGGYYMALYQMTGNSQCLEQAQIATFSEGTGGTAWLANFLLQNALAENRYPGVYFLSQEVARESFNAVLEKLELNGTVGNVNTGNISISEMFASADRAWANNGLADLFPGNLIDTAGDLIPWYNDLQLPPLASLEQSLQSAVDVVGELSQKNQLTLNNFLDRLGTLGTLSGLLGGFGGSILGKKLSDYEARPDQYRIEELPNASYKVAINISSGKVVGVFGTALVPTTLTEVLNFLALYGPTIAAAVVAGPAAALGVAVVTNVIAKFMEELHVSLSEDVSGFNGDIDPVVQNPRSTSPSAFPISSGPTSGDDTRWGTGGLIGFLYADTLYGGGGNDRMFGGKGGDELHGDGGSDIIYGQSGDDVLFGDAGNDLLRGGEDNDTLYGGSGRDTLDGGDITPAQSGNDVLNGGDEDDLLVGASGDDRLQGDGGSDDLLGGTGADTLDGGLGDDTLQGGAGNDTLIGGQGNDLYIWSSGDGNDKINETREADGKIHGRIMINGVTQTLDRLVSGLFIRQGSNNVWKSPDGAITITHNSPWKVLTSDGEIQLGETQQDFQEGDYGIVFREELSTASTRTILGDGKPADVDPAQPGDQIGFDDLGNIITQGEEAGRNDTLYGSSGADLVKGLGGSDYLRGNEGNDVLVGGANSDILVGGVEDDRLYSSEEVSLEQAIADGNDLVGTGLRGDWLNAGAGDDFVVAGVDNDVLFGGNGKDVLVGGAGDDVMDGDDDYTALSFNWTVTDYGNPFDRNWSPIEVENSPAGAADVLYGGAGNDFIAGVYGDDVLYGESGNDTLGGQDGGDTLLGGSGDDKMTGDYGKAAYDSGSGLVLQGDDYLDGEDGNDWLQGEGGDDQLFGGKGNDTVYGDASYSSEGAGQDYLDGEDGNDELWGGALDDDIFGGEGNDTLLGDALWVPVAQHGNDLLDGEGGYDQLRGYDGDDELFGGTGADTLQGDAGADYLDGEEDNDLLVAGDGNDTLYGGSGNDELQGQIGNDELTGEAGSDKLFGQEGDDYLDGSEDDDLLFGGDGKDTLFGGDGNDELQGQVGNDQLTGESTSSTVTSAMTLSLVAQAATSWLARPVWTILMARVAMTNFRGVPRPMPSTVGRRTTGCLGTPATTPWTARQATIRS